MSRLAISNIAWPDAAEAEAVGLCRALGFDGIELAPAKALGGWGPDAAHRARAYRARLADQGLAVPALQALTFGVEGCGLFDGAETRARLAAHLRAVAEIAGALGVRACVFGSPKLRDPGPLDPAAAFDLACGFFRAVAPAFADQGAVLAIEANVAAYGCRFVTRTEEAVALARAVGHPGFGFHLDAGTILANAEDPALLAAAFGQAAHFHASEPELRPLGSSGLDHAAIAAALAKAGYVGWRSIEMRAGENWRADIARAHGFLRATYG